MDSTQWDERYAGSDLVWSAGPNAMVARATTDLVPGRALDLASGEGRNAIWLATRGWRVTAVDFSAVASDRARRLGDVQLGAAAGRLETVTADVIGWEAEPAAYDLVLMVYFHVPRPQRRAASQQAVRALAPGGTLLVLGHHSDNLTHGVGGPQDPGLLFTPDEVVGDLDVPGLVVDRAERVRRPVPAPGSPDALDALVVAHRPQASEPLAGPA